MLKEFDSAGHPQPHADVRAPCAMLVDNAGSHTIDAAQSELSQFTTLIALPPNTTALIQPNDQGIIAAFKAVYRREFMRIVNDRLESEIAALKAAGTTIPPTLAAEVYSPFIKFNCFRVNMSSIIRWPRNSPCLMQCDAYRRHVIICNYIPRSFSTAGSTLDLTVLQPHNF